MSEEIPIEIRTALEQITSGGLPPLSRASSASRSTLSKQKIPHTPITRIVEQPKNNHRACAADGFFGLSIFKGMPRSVLGNFTGSKHTLSGRKP